MAKRVTKDKKTEEYEPHGTMCGNIQYSPTPLQRIELSQALQELDKEALVKFLRSHWCSTEFGSEAASIIGKKTVYLSGRKCTKYTVIQDQICAQEVTEYRYKLYSIRPN